MTAPRTPDETAMRLADLLGDHGLHLGDRPLHDAAAAVWSWITEAQVARVKMSGLGTEDEVNAAIWEWKADPRDLRTPLPNSSSDLLTAAPRRATQG